VSGVPGHISPLFFISSRYFNVFLKADNLAGEGGFADHHAIQQNGAILFWAQGWMSQLG
jgi:hypothetical protein